MEFRRRQLRKSVWCQADASIVKKICVCPKTHWFSMDIWVYIHHLLQTHLGILFKFYRSTAAIDTEPCLELRHRVSGESRVCKKIAKLKGTAGTLTLESSQSFCFTASVVPCFFPGKSVWRWKRFYKRLKAWRCWITPMSSRLASSVLGNPVALLLPADCPLGMASVQPLRKRDTCVLQVYEYFEDKESVSQIMELDARPPDFLILCNLYP